MTIYPKTEASRIARSGDGVAINYDVMSSAGTVLSTRDLYVPSVSVATLKEALASDLAKVGLAQHGGDHVETLQALVSGMTDQDWRALGL